MRRQCAPGSLSPPPKVSLGSRLLKCKLQSIFRRSTTKRFYMCMSGNLTRCHNIMKKQGIQYYSGIFSLLCSTILLQSITGSRASQSITLTSTLSPDRVAYPLEKVTFTCITRGANIQEWYSEEYITSEVDNRIQLHEGRRSGRGRAANATIISVETENETKVIVSELCIIVSSEYLMPTVSCGNNGFGFKENITFIIQVVMLNSTLERLHGEYVAYPHQRVHFICTTIGTNIQEWYSDEYITGVDNRIQLHEGRRSGSGRAANATIISIASNELGEKVIMSQLSFVVLAQYPVSTISCGNNGHGARKNITFRTQTINLTTTLEIVHDRYVAYPHQRVYFTCTTIGTNIQEWYSDEYITGVDNRIQLHEGRRSGRGRAANATIISVTTNEAGDKIIISQLILIISTQYPVSTVSCGNNGHQMREDVTFNITDPPPPKINSSLPLEGTACPGERIEFVCVTLDSIHLIWTSDNYTGSEGIHIGHSLPIGQPRNSTILPSTSAELVSRSEVNGRLQLTSRLTITASDESATDQTHSVTCSCMMDSKTVTFQIAADVVNNIEACTAVNTLGLNITTTRETIESSEEFRIYAWISIWAAMVITIIGFVASIVIFIIIMMRQKNKGKGKINRTPHKMEQFTDSESKSSIATSTSTLSTTSRDSKREAKDNCVAHAMEYGEHIYP